MINQRTIATKSSVDALFVHSCHVTCIFAQFAKAARIALYKLQLY
jgi:hypothetical protein